MLKILSYLSIAVLVLASSVSASTINTTTLAYVNLTMNLWSTIPANLEYTKDHVWVKVEGEIATIGFTDFGQSSIGEVRYVELPSIGRNCKRNDPLSVVESHKSVGDLYSPVEGVVFAVNDDVSNYPELVNEDPYGKGWFMKIKLSNPSQRRNLLSPESYRNLLDSKAISKEI